MEFLTLGYKIKQILLQKINKILGKKMTFQFEVNKKDLITKRCSLNVIKNIYKNRLIFYVEN